MTPPDVRETDAAFANALLDSATADGPGPDALGRELERLGLGTVAGVVAITALAGSGGTAATTTTVAAASKLTAASFVSATALKIGVAVAIVAAGASYVALKTPSPTRTEANARAVTSAAVPTASATSEPPIAAVPSPPTTAVSLPATAAATSRASNAPSSAATPSGAPPPRAAEDARALAAEVSLVDRARTLAHSSPDAALALLDEHARTFPSGALRDEAAVVRVEALLAAGRRADAERVARPFLAERVGTPLARRLSDLLGAPNRPIP